MTRGLARVVVVAFDLRRSGGMERLTLDVVQGIRDLGLTCEVIDTRRLGGSWVGRQLGRLLFLGRLARAVQRADMVLSMHQLFLPAICPLLALSRIVRRRDKQRLLCWIHGIEVWGTALLRAKPALQRCDRLIASSAFTRDRILEVRGTWPPCSVVHPMAKVVDPTVPPTPLPERMVILTVAGLTKDWDYKGHDTVLGSLRLLRDRGKLPVALQWRIVGDGDRREALERTVLEAGFGDSVRFLGSIDDDALEREYRGCSLFVMPSQYSVRGAIATGEGFGIVYLEAANAGRASIACNQGGQTDLIEDGVNGWLIPDSPRELADLLEWLIAHPSEVERAGMEAHRVAVRNFGETRFLSALRDGVLDP